MFFACFAFSHVCYLYESAQAAKIKNELDIIKMNISLFLGVLFSQKWKIGFFEKIYTLIIN